MESSTKNYENMLDNYGNSSEFYKNEILPDYQEHARNMLAKLRAIPDATLNHIGVEEISGITAKEKYFIDFASNSSFHGLNHIVARRRHPVERYWMFLFIGVCLISEIFVSLIFWYRYQDEGVIVVVDLKQEKLKISRPSLLICSTKRIDEKKFPETFQRYDVKDTPETRSFFQFLSTVDYKTMHDTPDFDAVPPEKWLRILYDLRYEFYLTFVDMQDAMALWVITERGICISVRNYKSIYATLEYWLQDNWTVIPPPEVLPFFTYENQGNIETVKSFTSMTITMYDPSEMFEYQFNPIDVQYPKFVRYTFSISEYSSQKEVLELSVNQRKCNVAEDGGLKIWPEYTFKMCVIECRYQTIRQHCGCFPHFARPIADVPICDAAQLRCIGNIKDQLFLYHVPTRCNCLRNCKGVYYTVDNFIITTTTGASFQNTSVFNMIVKFPNVVVKRVQIFGFNDFLTAIGGAAGLFLGASVLSFIEIFYYATLRMWVYCAKRKRRRNTIVEKFVKN